MKRLFMTSALLTALVRPALGGCAFQLSGASATIASTINYVAPNAPPGVMDAAIHIWSTDCSGGFGGGFPELVSLVGTSSNDGVINVDVSFVDGPSTNPEGSCGHTDLSIDRTTNQITGASITIWKTQADGTDCSGSYAEIVAHEIGHTLNLDDVSWSSACDGTIMGKNPGYVSADQCQLVDNDWLTFRECPDCRDWTREFQCKY
jgi:hypothetical protein